MLLVGGWKGLEPLGNVEIGIIEGIPGTGDEKAGVGKAGAGKGDSGTNGPGSISISTSFMGGAGTVEGCGIVMLF